MKRHADPIYPRPIDVLVALGGLAAVAIFVGVAVLVILWIASGYR